MLRFHTAVTGAMRRRDQVGGQILLSRRKSWHSKPPIDRHLRVERRCQSERQRRHIPRGNAGFGDRQNWLQSPRVPTTNNAALIPSRLTGKGQMGVFAARAGSRKEEA